MTAFDPYTDETHIPDPGRPSTVVVLRIRAEEARRTPAVHGGSQTSLTVRAPRLARCLFGRARVRGAGSSSSLEAGSRAGVRCCHWIGRRAARGLTPPGRLAPMIARADALASARLRDVRRRRRRRRHHGRGRRVRRRDARLQRRARRARRLRGGHVEPLVQARPRRPALPAELRPRPRARGAARAPAHGRARAAPRAPAAARRRRVRRRAARTADRRRPEPLRRHVRRAPAPVGAAAPARRSGATAAAADPSEWSPERHRMISGDEVRRARARARARASRPPATSSTTARPTTRGSS